MAGPSLGLVTPGKRQDLGVSSNQRAIDVVSAGSLSVIVPTPQYDILLYHMSIAGPASTIAKVYGGGVVAPGTFKATSYLGQLDDADWDSGLLVSSSDDLFVVWYSIAAPASFLAPVNITTAAAGAAMVTSAQYEQSL